MKKLINLIIFILCFSLISGFAMTNKLAVTDTDLNKPDEINIDLEDKYVEAYLNADNSNAITFTLVQIDSDSKEKVATYVDAIDNVFINTQPVATVMKISNLINSNIDENDIFLSNKAILGHTTKNNLGGVAILSAEIVFNHVVNTDALVVNDKETFSSDDVLMANLNNSNLKNLNLSNLANIRAPGSFHIC